MKTVILFRNKANGEGIFTFYSENAKEILTDFKAAKLVASSRQKEGKTKDAGSLKRRNPLSFLFKRQQEPSGISLDQTKANAGGAGRGDEKKQRGRRKVMEKSVSMMDNFHGAEERTREKPTSKRLSMIEAESRTERGGRGHKSSSLSRPRSNQAAAIDQAYFRSDPGLPPPFICLYPPAVTSGGVGTPPPLLPLSAYIPQL